MNSREGVQGVLRQLLMLRGLYWVICYGANQIKEVTAHSSKPSKYISLSLMGITEPYESKNNS